MKRILILFIFSIQFACTTKPYWPEKASFETISIDASKAKTINQSALYEDAKYIQLESNDSILMKNILRLESISDRYFFLCENGIFQFDKNGAFINKISKTISHIRSFADMSIDTVTRTIQIYDNSSKMFFTSDYEGKISETWENHLDGYTAVKINNNLSAVYIGASYYNETANHKLNYINKKGEIVKKYFPINEHETKFMHFSDLNNFPASHNTQYFQYSFNDTIYSLNEAGVKPVLFIDFGKDRLPDSIFRKDYMDVRHFYETIKFTPFSFQAMDFLESAGITFFAFTSGEKTIHAFVENKSSILLADSIIEDLKFGTWKEPTTSINLPMTTDGENFYSILEGYAFYERVNSLKKAMLPLEWNSYKINNRDILSVYDKFSVTSNPIVVILYPKKSLQ